MGTLRGTGWTALSLAILITAGCKLERRIECATTAECHQRALDACKNGGYDVLREQGEGPHADGRPARAALEFSCIRVWPRVTVWFRDVTGRA
jgi:hypothetical protein